VTEERFTSLVRDQQRFRARLAKFLSRAYPPLVVKHLIRCLQAGGGGGRSSSVTLTPKWVRKVR
jgi:hypothetical protein